MRRGAFIAKSLIIGAFGILALHSAVAAYRENAQRVERFALLLFKYRGTHAYREFVHAHAVFLGGDEVTELVDNDYKLEDEQREKYA